MARPKPTEADIERRKIRAAAVKKFMEEFNFTEARLAEHVGISRRSVQMIKAAAVTPTPTSARKIEAMFAKYGFAYSTK